MKEQPDIGRVLSQYRQNMKEDLLALWKIWVPSTFLNFALMPMWGRIPWVAGTSLVWTCILSAMRGGDVAHGEDMAGGAVTGATLHLMEEGYGMLFTSPVELERDRNHLIITASGEDKIGWVSMLSNAVASAGGNITHSKMVRLGNDFIVVMHTSIPPEEFKNLRRVLRKDPDLKPLNVRLTSIQRRHTGTYQKPLTGVRIRCVGEDKPALLAKLSTAIAERGLSIENISTDVVVGFNGRREFHVNADCALTSYMEKEELDAMVSDLSHLKESLQLDVVDIRAQRLVNDGES